jgi:negative regulator of replication initiation
MIQDEFPARQVSDLMLEYGTKLDASVAAMQSLLSEEEFIKYRRAIGRVMGAMLLDVMNPLYEMHPQMKPAQLD